MNGYRIVSIIVSAVLLFAATMKYWTLTEVSIHPEYITWDWWVLLAGFVLETVLGGWLLTGVFCGMVRWFTVLVFTTFASIAVSKGIRGEATCSCFGPMAIDPWLVAAMDGLIVIALVRYSPSVAVESRGLGVQLVGSIGIAVFGMGLGLSAYASVTAIGRGLVVSETDHEFGVVGQGQRLTHVFKLHNTCSFPVEIVESKTTCACSSIEDISGDVIPAGQVYDLPVTLMTRDSNEHIVGGAKIFCRRAGTHATPTFFSEFRVSSIVDPDYWVGPIRLDFGKWVGPNRVAQQIRFRPNRVPDVVMLECESSHPCLEGKILEGRTEDGHQILEVAFDCTKVNRSQRLEATVRVKTSSPNQSEFRVLAGVNYESPWEVEPNTIMVGSDIRGEIVRTIRVRSKHAIQVETPATSSRGMSLRSLPLDELGAEWEVRLTMPSTEQTNFNDEVRFVVRDRGETREVIVPVHRFRSSQPMEQTK